jgi:hypothetical protein
MAEYSADYSPALSLAGRLLVIAGATLSLAAQCAQRQDKADDAAMTLLQARLPGRYDNVAQARAEARSGSGVTLPAIDLLIMPANAALIGKATFYVRETAAGDPQRVLSQYIWVFGRAVEVHPKGEKAPKPVDKDGKEKEEHLEQHIYLFKEPHRWLQVGEQPELLEALLPSDLDRLTGCDLLWTTKESGFVAERRSTTCSPALKSEGQQLEQKIELKDNNLAMFEQQITADGLVDAPASPSDPEYRFTRRGAAK